MMDEEISVHREFYDNVHGFIKVTKLENQIIDSPFFQRLRNIRQLGLEDYVFPGALHNRFNHSLGVLQLADKMAISLQENLTKKKSEIKVNRKLVRMAALLHDIGHYPLSHLIESVVKNHALLNISTNEISIEGNTTANSNIEDNGVHKLNIDLYEASTDFNFAHHERIGGIVIFQTEIYDILKNGNFSDDEIRATAQILAGKYPGPESLIIHSELDADRFDYLLRDSQQTGVTYGLFDVDQIIRNLEYMPEKEWLAVSEKARKAIEHYLLCRYFFYSTVIYHKTSIAFEWMVKEIYKGLMERKLVHSYLDLIEILENRESSKTFLDYDDSYFFNMLKDVINRKKKWENIEYDISDEFLFELIEKLLNRKPIKLYDESQKLVINNVDDYLFSNPMVKNRIIKEAEIEDYWYILNELNIPITEISPYRSLSDTDYSSQSKDESVKIIKASNSGANETVYLVDDENSIINILSKYKLKINRLYTKNDDYKQKINDAYTMDK